MKYSSVIYVPEYFQQYNAEISSLYKVILQIKYLLYCFR